MNAFAQHFAFEFRTGLRNKTLLFLDYVFPLAVFLLISTLMTQLNPAFRSTLIAVMVCFVGMSVPLLGVPDPMVKARDEGIYRSFKIHGVPERSILAIPALTTLLHVAVVVLIIVLSAPALFGAPLPVNGPAFLLGFLLITIDCAALSVLIGVISSDGRATVLLAQAIFLPSMMIGGLMIPTESLPEGLRVIGLLLPTTQAMNVMTGSIPGYSPLVSALVLGSTAVLAFVFAKLLFKWDKRNTTTITPLAALAVLVPSLLGLIAYLLLT